MGAPHATWMAEGVGMDGCMRAPHLTWMVKERGMDS